MIQPNGDQAQNISSSADSPTTLEYDGVALDFVEPKEAYNILGVTEFGAGYAVIYQQAMPDSFNKIYSPDDVFYNISTQLFSAEGVYLKTVDSQWHNAIKITEPLLRLSPHADTITFEVWRENETGQTEAGCFTLALTEQGVEALGENPNHYLYSYRLFNELTADGEMQLQFTVARGDLLKFRLAGWKDAALEQAVTITDASFLKALYNTAYGIDKTDWLNDNQNPLYVLDISLDAQAKTARLSNGKITCRVNFDGGAAGCTVTRRYTESMLGEQVAVSLDGVRQIYTADVYKYIADDGCDYVVCGPEGITFLYAGSKRHQLYFLDNDRIFVNTFDTLRFYDAATGAVLSPGPQFDFGTQQSHYNKLQSGIARFAAGTAVDEENRVLLVAYRPYTFGSGVFWKSDGEQTQNLPVSLATLDWDGRLLREYDTGATMLEATKFFTNFITVKVNGNGTADLLLHDADGNKVQVRYLA